MWGVRGRALSHPRPLVLSGSGRGPLPTGCGCRGMRAWGPVTNPTARAPASWLCALWGQHEGARGGCLLPGCGVSEVGRCPSPDHPSFRACGRGLLPTGRWYGVRAWGPGCPWGLVSCRGCGRRRAFLACLAAPRWCAAPRPVQSLPVLSLAVAPGPTGWLRGARGGRPRNGLIVPAAGPCRGKGAGRAPRRTGSRPRNGVVSGGSLRLWSWAASAAVVWRAWTRSLTRPVSRTVRLATGESAAAPGLVRVDAHTAPFRSEDATPGSCACVRVRALLGRVGQAGLRGAFWCTSPFPMAVSGPLFACSAPSGLGLPRLWLLLGLFFCFFSPSPPRCAPVVSCFACFPAPGALGLGVLSPPPFSFPPPPRCAPLSPALRVFRPGVPWALASCCPSPPSFFFFFLCPLPPSPPCCLWRFLPSGCLGPLRPPSPPSFFLGFLLFLFLLFFSPFFLFFPFAGCAVRGGFVCLGPSGVPRWCCPCRCSVCAGWCCVVLAVRPGCPPLSRGGSWCRALVVLSLSGRVARRPVVRRGVSWCSAALCCVLLRGAVVWWCAVVFCRLFASSPVPVVCFLLLRICCVRSGVSCCVFPVLPVRCAVRVVCAVSGGWCCWFLVSLPSVWGLLVALVAWRCRLLVCVGSVVAVAGRLPCGVLLPCAVSCGAVLPCGAVPWCSSSFFVFLPARGAGFLLSLVGSRLRAGSGSFLFLCSACTVLCWCACVVALCSVLSCPRGAGWCFVLLPVVFVCLLLGLAVLFCLLVGPGGSWCCVSVACCVVSLGAVQRRVAARCAAWRSVVVRCVVSFCSVWCCRALCCVLGRCPSSWGPVPSGAVFCLVPPRCVCFAVVCRCVVLFAVVLCAVCALGCRVVRFLSSPPCAVLLCGPLSLGALLPCAVCHGAVLPRGAVVSCPAALLGLFLAWVWLYLLEKPLQNFVKFKIQKQLKSRTTISGGNN